MSRASRKATPAPPTPDAVMPTHLGDERRNGHDELNVARLSLISAQSRVPAGYTGWTRTYQTGERTVTVTCTALTGHVVPHGLDNDVMVAIINLYLEDGCPEDGTVRVSLHRLLLAAGLHASAHYYREVRQSLRRLQSTSYQITQGWLSQGRQRHLDATFNYLWKVTATRDEKDDAGSVLEIRLPDEIALSIRDGYVKPLDLTLYRELSSPPVRAVYRVLDALRWDSGSAQDRVTINLLEWGERLSIYSTEPDKIRRVLQPAHDELRERGILLDVEVTGRGKSQELTYVFASPTRNCCAPSRNAACIPPWLESTSRNIRIQRRCTSPCAASTRTRAASRTPGPCCGTCSCTRNGTPKSSPSPLKSSRGLHCRPLPWQMRRPMRWNPASCRNSRRCRLSVNSHAWSVC
ncbi:replication initiator protein A [Deinococcus daejeonensis]|uniref:Replication initiator protein A n=1 Tax=Deinococcus daejeonensis TaxID=1007098 RepID=A0ABQ2J9C3_9DEIO|nr:replication initiator protein A [Deinococcus daejeonensis]GGN42910.1 hypothetical protein GCM10010842_29830 [Deinococcus daejeonensis]